ncbi:hypothetical protein E2C01_028383 [Portunus trituberculatus]|uniref:Uncharacterized protein n=1 Tax=Portunus trituberculatus TaxID=210409 RepID=A0A5B7ENZ7_PORTR|nr:hypothetical protein [Portunus trituberculatus]
MFKTSTSPSPYCTSSTYIIYPLESKEHTENRNLVPGKFQLSGADDLVPCIIPHTFDPKTASHFSSKSTKAEKKHCII